MSNNKNKLGNTKTKVSRKVSKLSFKRTHYIIKKQRVKTNSTRMWANAQPDGRPARWRPLFNAAKFANAHY